MENFNFDMSKQLNNFEGQVGGVPERALDFMSPDEILGQLNISATKYEKVIDDLKMGNLANIGYAEEMERNLAGYRDSFIQKIGTMTPKDKEISDKVTERLFKLREMLKTAKTSH